jgi:hypothetical protein
VLARFFQREDRFFLTGGAALAGFHLGHRTTQDLDLFAAADIVEDGDRVLRLVAAELKASIESLRTAPGFRRYLVRLGSDAVVVDLVHDLVPPGH